MKNELKVTIAGLPGAGKSTLLDIINRALIDASFNNCLV